MSDTGQTDVPDQHRAIAQLVSGYVDDKLAEFRAEIGESLDGIVSHLGVHQSVIASTQATLGGLRDAVSELQATKNESMPEHVYKQFIRAEAERLRIVKPVRERRESPADTESPAPTPTPDNVT